jgi:FKBP-type peptidyl-prolyl cis-trans isomerase FkpA
MRVFILLLVLSIEARAQYADDAPRRTVGLTPAETLEVFKAIGGALNSSLEPFSLSDAELEAVITGLREAHTKPMTAERQQWLSRVKELENLRRSKRLTLEKERGKKFVEEAKTHAGATVSASGLVYFSVLDGLGYSPNQTDQVKLHYRGTLVDGQEFDSSYKKGPAVIFGVSQVVPCFSEALKKMKPGGRAKFICPSSIAYGDKGSPPAIPPGATLQFEVELIAIQPPNAAPKE